MVEFTPKPCFKPFGDAVSDARRVGDADTYEVQSCKKSIKLNLPIQVRFLVYQYAKLRMLQFYYDFLDKYLDRSDYQTCKMDTDSAYIAIAGDSVESLMKLELRPQFEQL